MSVTNCPKFCETGSTNENSLNNPDVVRKFEKYRLKVEQMRGEYEEAGLVIDRLKEEINLCRDMEKRNSLEILSLRSQLKILEEKRKTFFSVSEKQISIQKALQKHEESITGIKNAIQRVKENCENKISTASKEMELLKENKYFRSALKCKEETLEIVKNNMKNALKEKEELIQQYTSKNNHLNEELEKLKLERDEIQDICNRTVESYRKKIEEYEAIIEKMERERTRILADYEVSAIPETNYESSSTNCKQDQKIFKSPPRATTRFFNERENISTAENIRQKKCENFSTPIQVTGLKYSQDIDFDNKKDSFGECLKNIPKSRSKRKPTIDFIGSCQPQEKRRLYSENDNNFLN